MKKEGVKEQLKKIKELLTDDLKELDKLEGNDLIFLVVHRFLLYRKIIEKFLEGKIEE